MQHTVKSGNAAAGVEYYAAMRFRELEFMSKIWGLIVNYDTRCFKNHIPTEFISFLCFEINLNYFIILINFKKGDSNPSTNPNQDHPNLSKYDTQTSVWLIRYRNSPFCYDIRFADQNILISTTVVVSVSGALSWLNK